MPGLWPQEQVVILLVPFSGRIFYLTVVCYTFRINIIQQSERRKEMFKLGAITVGQSPRTDVTDDIMGIFQGKVEILERGALDGLTVEDIDKLAPDAGEYVLVSRMRDGSQVSFSEQKILPRIQECIERLEAEGVKMILFFCTGEFDYKFKSRVPLIFPCDLISRLIPVLCGDRQLIVVTPTQRQVQQSQEKWRKYVNDVVTVAASPYGGWEEIEQACRKISALQGPLVVMDCIGYSFAMKREVAEKTGKTVVLSRTMAARVISELSDI